MVTPVCQLSLAQWTTLISLIHLVLLTPLPVPLLRIARITPILQETLISQIRPVPHVPPVQPKPPISLTSPAGRTPPTLTLKPTWYTIKKLYNASYKTDERVLRQIMRNKVSCNRPNDKLKLIVYYKSSRISRLIIKNDQTPT